MRIEPDGFGIVEFDHRVGANTHGVFSTTIGSTVPFGQVKPGMHVSGVAEVSDRDSLRINTPLATKATQISNIRAELPREERMTTGGASRLPCMVPLQKTYSVTSTARVTRNPTNRQTCRLS